MRHPSGTLMFVATFVLAAASGLARADARSDVLDAFQKMMDSRFAIDARSTSDGETTTSHAEYDTIKRIHMKTAEMEMIVLPGSTWMRSGDGEWSQPPFDMGAMASKLVPQTIGEMQKGITNVKDEGAATWQGQPARILSYDMDTKVMMFTVSSHNRIWLDAQGRIIHSEAESTAMGKQSHTEQDIRYDDSIRVNAPG
jgi:hypothetical protein